MFYYYLYVKFKFGVTSTRSRLQNLIRIERIQTFICLGSDRSASRHLYFGMKSLLL